MGLISRYANVIVSSRSIYYENLGYKIPKKDTHSYRGFVYDIGKTFEVKVEDVLPYSKVDLEYECDLCKKHFVSNSVHLRKAKITFCSKCLELNDGTISKPATYDGENIAKTDEWAVALFEDKNIPSLYKRNSHKKAFFHCEICNKVYQQTIREVVIHKRTTCEKCKDKISYPNKFLRNMLEQLKIKATYEYSPNWLKPYRYDSYFKIDNNEYVIEMDGGLGHGNREYKTNQIDTEGVIRDGIKDSLAQEHNVKVIRIDATVSDIEYIKNSFINSYVSELFDLSVVDWKECGKFALSNLIKEVCLYYNNCSDSEKTMQNLQDKFHISKDTARNYLKKGTLVGLCEYDKELSEQTRKQNALMGIRNAMKPIYVFDKDMNFLHEFKNVHDCVESMKKIYDVSFAQESVRCVCRGERKKLYGFIFKYERKGDEYGS